MRIKAAVLEAFRQPLVVQDVELAPPRRSEVLVRLAASGLCHTDMHAMTGDRPRPLPAVLGHEGAGVVEAIGEGVSSVRVGDHVICSWAPNCGHCFYCDEGQPILCDAMTAASPAGVLFDGSSRLSLDGQPVYHFTMVSSHAEYCVVPENAAIPIPKQVPLDRACLIGCGVMTGVGAVIRNARVRPGSSVVVFGCGGVGLNVLQGARLANASTIVAVDLNPRKLELARVFGATHTVNAGSTDAVQAVRELTGGRGADYSFEAVGHPGSIRDTLAAVRKGGRAVILGMTPAGTELCLPFDLLLGEKVITRSSYGGGRPRVDFPRLAKLYLEGKLMLDELITTRLSLDEINGGFARVEAGDVARAVVVFPQAA
jgi:S-(hydroxymethyl)glutathione dehydrogenase/alcohol dehydrogenase